MILTAGKAGKKAVAPVGETAKKDAGAQLLPGLPATRDWFDWQPCRWSATGELLAEADGAGFEAVEWRIDWKRGLYEIRFQREQTTRITWEQMTEQLKKIKI